MMNHKKYERNTYVPYGYSWRVLSCCLTLIQFKLRNIFFRIYNTYYCYYYVRWRAVIRIECSLNATVNISNAEISIDNYTTWCQVIGCVLKFLRCRHNAEIIFVKACCKRIPAIYSHWLFLCSSCNFRIMVRKPYL